MLEPYAVKVARTVLRGATHSNVGRVLDLGGKNGAFFHKIGQKIKTFFNSTYICFCRMPLKMSILEDPVCLFNDFSKHRFAFR